MNTAVRVNPLRQLQALGQSVWLDDIRRSWLQDGTLSRLIAEDGVAGVTSNPAIFGKAIADTRDYDAAIVQLARRGWNASTMYEGLVIEDIQGAADLLRRVYGATDRCDGYVSLEVSPHLAHDTEGTVAEARRLWASVDRPNLMVKVPGTRAGLPAIRRLIASGINVNVTLLFSVERYREAARAYIEGLEEYASAGHAADRVASVASFFLSRIDVAVDRRLDAIERPIARAAAQKLRGQAAVACARVAYRAYEEFIADARWRALVQRGARSQRLLWASTGTKDPAYSEVKYVDALIGADTVNTMPYETLTTYRDHGEPAARLTEDTEGALALPAQLAQLGIELPAIVAQLEEQGVQKFIAPYDKLLALLERRRIAERLAHAE
jgi:transaldolase